MIAEDPRLELGTSEKSYSRSPSTKSEVVFITRFDSHKNFERYLGETTIKARPQTRLISVTINDPVTRLQTISNSDLRASPCDEMPSKSHYDNESTTGRCKEDDIVQ